MFRGSYNYTDGGMFRGTNNFVGASDYIDDQIFDNFCLPFVENMRQEPALKARVLHAIKMDKAGINIDVLSHFYNLFVFKDASEPEKMNFTLNLLASKESEKIGMKEVLNILNILYKRVEDKSNVELLHRPLAVVSKT